jgi:hypothetical protein
MERNASVAERARQLYRERFKQTLEKNSFGQFVAIEVDSKEYFLGSTPLQAINNAQKKYASKPFHVIKIGYDEALLIKLGKNIDLVYRNIGTICPAPSKRSSNGFSLTFCS